MKTWFLLVLFPLFAGIKPAAQPDKVLNCIHLPAEEFFIRLHQAENPLLLDTRTYEEYRKERIPEALLAPDIQSLEEILDTCDHEQPVFTYCSNDYRSPVACEFLTDGGFARVYNLEGGLEEWERLGYPMDERNLKRIRVR